MKTKIIVILVALAFYSVFSVYLGCGKKNESRVKNLFGQDIAECPQPTAPFPSYSGEYGPPDWWCKENKVDPRKYTIFQIKSDFPSNYADYVNASSTSETSCPECGWKKFDFKKKEQQDNYLKAVMKYVFEGNLENDWVAQKNTIGRQWFHAPYMHLDIVEPTLNASAKDAPIIEKVAREFIHGLTMERTGCVNELKYKLGNSDCDPLSKDSSVNFQSWAISFYNARGASYLGKVWDEMLHPKSNGVPDPANFPPQGFPDGTVAVKLLFTQATPKDLGYLEGSPVWQADTADFIKESYQTTKRMREKCSPEMSCENKGETRPTELRLLQIDVAVRDNRELENEKSPTGWVFATFTYDSSAPPYIEYESPESEKDKINSWLRIKPLGLMFGNDPGKTLGSDINESILNTDLDIPEHYGCGDVKNIFKRRLNGPVDNPKSSCLSCHAQSETPQNLNISQMPYKEMECNDDALKRWFENIDPRTSNPPTATPSKPDNAILSLDYSLQLRESISRFCVESYNKVDTSLNRENRCRLKPFKLGDNFNYVTKSGTQTFTIK